MDELKPCPFCGGEAERIDFGPGDAENEGGSCIACKRCQSSGPVEFGYKETFISKWNTRAASGGMNEPFGNPEQFASLEQRARTTELLRLHAEPIPVAVEDGVWFMVREQDALDAITAALANQQGVES